MATEKDKERVVSLLKPSERYGQLMKNFSTLGSGPAYVYIAIEALADGGGGCWSPRDLALALASQTVLGAASMVDMSGKHPGQLKDAVTSPAGTTIAGIHELEKGGFRGTLMSAVIAATKRGALAPRLRCRRMTMRSQVRVWKQRLAKMLLRLIAVLIAVMSIKTWTKCLSVECAESMCSDIECVEIISSIKIAQSPDGPEVVLFCPQDVPDIVVIEQKILMRNAEIEGEIPTELPAQENENIIAISKDVEPTAEHSSEYMIVDSEIRAGVRLEQDNVCDEGTSHRVYQVDAS
ncbi:Pyrroline-5-carboxylate reductase [Platanthera guangdongensis]|uniref:Pyrroline-5-carboxylate reductase n=1 Tax=Platanthera guangdongensis TaxID=2320717 RepID=A0ABR2LHG7_9ASPA